MNDHPLDQYRYDHCLKPDPFFADMFSNLFPDFFRDSEISSLPADQVFSELVIDLWTFQPQNQQTTVRDGIQFGEYRGEIGPLRDAVKCVEEEWVQYFQKQDRFFCAYDNGRIVSFCILSDFGTFQGLRVGGPGCVGTLPEYRRSGIGLELVRQATDVLRRDGFDYSWIHYTHLESWYAKVGYQPVIRWTGKGLFYCSLLSATSNTRDLGGCKTESGQRVISDRVLRSDAPTVRNPKDEEYLKKHGITTIVDLRTEDEIMKKPCAYRGTEGILYFHVPVTEGTHPPARLEDVPASYMKIALCGQMGKALKILAQAPKGVMICCTAGKDRTGVLAALLLLACHVSKQMIIRDYALSREYNRERLERYLSEHPEVDRKVVLANESSMDSFLTMLTEQFGTVEQYMRSAGLTEEEILHIRAKLLDPEG